MLAKFLSTAAVFAVFAAGAAQAQSGRVPAEMPPASYTESQYVDSNGCVFIRAGFNGSTTWVPRFGDDRQPMCGFAPSLGGAVPVAAAAPTPMPAPAQAAATAPAQAAPAPVTVRTVAASAAPRRVAPAPTASARASAPYSVAPETAVARPAQGAMIYQAQAGALDTRWSFHDRTGPSPCTEYNALSQLYAVPSPEQPNLPLRCGPQAVHPADALREQSPNGGRWEPWTGATPAPDNNVYILPPPYAPRWPQPYLQGASMRQMQEEMPTRAATTTAVSSQPAIRGHVSTMGATDGVSAAPVRAQPPGQMSNGQYVQVGTYGVESNARATVARLQQSGLPVATGQARRGGQALQVVLAGPFRSQAELSAALGRARAMGYSDAFIR